MLNILINSYTCCPNMGSEQGMGWNWIISIAKYCECHVISEGEYRLQVENWLNEPRNAELAKRIHFYWNPVTPKIRKMCWNQGDWRFYKYYKKWQEKTADIAREICKNVHVDVLHQLNMIGFREPGFLWKVSKETGIPFVWGPIGGLKQFPLAYSEGGGLGMRTFNFVKNGLNVLQIKYDRRVAFAIKHATVLISSIPDSYNSIKRNYGKESCVIPETGCFISENVQVPPKGSVMQSKEASCQSVLKVLWVGKFDFRKRLDIAIKAIAKVNPNIQLFVYGTGNRRQVAKAEELVRCLGVEDRVTFMGNCPNSEVKEAMQKADLFLFTSVSEDTSTVVLEAISNKLPVLCFDACGMSAVIDDSVGRKIPLSTPSQSVDDFADQLGFFYTHPSELIMCSENCTKRAYELSWENKGKQIFEIYNSL